MDSFQIWVYRCVLEAVILSEGRSPKSKDLLSAKEILRLRRVAAPLRMTVLNSPINPYFSFLYIIPKNFFSIPPEIFKITLYISTHLCYNL